ncbi:MAG: heat-shock protein [Ramlibacter sp.]|nr:heat-shock protein [Ramlibacter sp.]
MRAAVPALGIDFGTSNSAVSFTASDGVARLVPLEGAATTLPTAVFFSAEDHRVSFGREAISHYLAGTEGRLMRSLKSLLGSSLLEEETAVGGTMLSFQAIIARFLTELRGRAGRHLGAEPRRAVIGRPVHFVDGDAARDRRAQAALAQAAASAGFDEVSFELEPIAAALDYERRIAREALVLVVDIGGGTSDFTLVRLGPGRMRQADRSGDILATAGVHIGGTDYDQKLNLRQVMPLLGFRHIGPSGREVPSPPFLDLSSWHLIHWMTTPKMVRQVRQLRSDYSDTRLHDRLMTVLDQRLGHLVASEVEQAKIRGSVSGGWSRWWTAPRRACSAPASRRTRWMPSTSPAAPRRCGLSKSCCASGFRLRRSSKATCSAGWRRGCRIQPVARRACRGALRATRPTGQHLP